MNTSEFARLDRRRLLVSSAMLGGAAMLSSAGSALAGAARGLPTGDRLSAVRAFGDGLRQGNATRGVANAAQYEMEVAWTLELDSDWSYESSLVQAGDSVYFASNKTIYALDAATGTELWRFVGPNDENSTALSVVDDVVFFGIREDHLYAVDALEGTVIWRFEVLGECSAPQVVDGVVYFADESDYIYALDAQQGSERWRCETPIYDHNEIRIGPPRFVESLIVIDDIVYFGSSDYPETVWAVRADDGTNLWRFENPNEFSDFSIHPVVGDNVAYLHSQSNVSGGSLFAVDTANGQELWSIGSGDPFENDYFGPIIDFALRYGVVYATRESYNVSIGAFDARTGNKLWETFATNEDDPNYIVAVSDGMVYTRDYENLFAFDAATGASIWSKDIMDFNLGNDDPVFWNLDDRFIVYHGNGVVALDKASQQEIWRYSPSQEFGEILRVWTEAELVYSEEKYYDNGSDVHQLVALRLRPVVPILEVGAVARVTATTSLRGGPSPTAVVRAELEPDILVTLTGEVKLAGSVEWWPVSVNETGAEGWVEASSLEPVASGSEPTATPTQ